MLSRRNKRKHWNTIAKDVFVDLKKKEILDNHSELGKNFTIPGTEMPRETHMEFKSFAKNVKNASVYSS